MTVLMSNPSGRELLRIYNAMADQLRKEIAIRIPQEHRDEALHLVGAMAAIHEQTAMKLRQADSLNGLRAAVRNDLEERLAKVALQLADTKQELDQRAERNDEAPPFPMGVNDVH